MFLGFSEKYSWHMPDKIKINNIRMEISGSHTSLSLKREDLPT